MEEETIRLNYFRLEFTPEIFDTDIANNDDQVIGKVQWRRINTMVNINGQEYHATTIVNLVNDTQNWIDGYLWAVKDIIKDAFQSYIKDKGPKFLYLDEDGFVVEE